MREKTHYDRLEIPFGAPESAIRRAYRRKAREYHPDHHSPSKREEVREKFEKVKQAYNILIDPQKRALYDRDLAHDGSVPLRNEEFWQFWRQYLSDYSTSREKLSYHEKMVMDSFEEDWLEENYGGTAKDRYRFRKHLNFGKIQLAQDNIEQAYREFIRADTICEKNILSKFYVGYTLELKGKIREALKRYRFAVNIGLSRPDRHVNKCLRIRRRMVELYEKLGDRGKARQAEQVIEQLERCRSGFEQYLDSDLEAEVSSTRGRRFLKWLASFFVSQMKKLAQEL